MALKVPFFLLIDLSFVCVNAKIGGKCHVNSLFANACFSNTKLVLFRFTEHHSRLNFWEMSDLIIQVWHWGKNSNPPIVTLFSNFIKWNTVWTLISQIIMPFKYETLIIDGRQSNWGLYAALMTLLHRTAITMANNYSQKCPSKNTLFSERGKRPKITIPACSRPLNFL